MERPIPRGFDCKDTKKVRGHIHHGIHGRCEIKGIATKNTKNYERGGRVSTTEDTEGWIDEKNGAREAGSPVKQGMFAESI